MKHFIALAIVGLLAVSATAEAQRRKSEYKPRPGPQPQHIVSPLPSEYIDDATLPDNWDWRVRNIDLQRRADKFCLRFFFFLQNISGVNYCSLNRNQHIPVIRKDPFLTQKFLFVIWSRETFCAKP
jgi:hypothetical protein